jgi:hypothetical protein
MIFCHSIRPVDIEHPAPRVRESLFAAKSPRALTCHAGHRVSEETELQLDRERIG